MKKKLLILIWLLILLSGPIVILSKTPLPIVTKDVGQLIRLLQRIAALIAFSAIFTQIIIGAYISKLSKIFGSWIRKFHVFQGIVAYAFVLAHPLLFVVLNFKTRGVFDPFYVFTDICLLCPRPFELHYSFGRIAFWLISLAILAAIIKSETWWRKNWRKFHILNYFVFFLIAVHAWFSGTDTKIAPFSYIYWILISTVVFIFFYKWVYPRLLKLLALQDRI